MKFLQYPLIALLCSSMVIIPTTGCAPVTQSKVNSVVQNIANWAPVITNDAANLGTAIASFDPADAVQIQQYVSIMQKDGALLTTLCNQYLAAPTSSTLAQIASVVGELATTDSTALLQVLQIKNSNSLMLAKGILATIATAVTILSTYLATINVQVSPAAKQAIKNMSPVVQKVVLVSELNKAKSQGLIPQSTQIESFGF